jgi:hypothetical protein
MVLCLVRLSDHQQTVSAASEAKKDKEQTQSNGEFRLALGQLRFRLVTHGLCFLMFPYG